MFAVNWTTADPHYNYTVMLEATEKNNTFAGGANGYRNETELSDGARYNVSVAAICRAKNISDPVPVYGELCECTLLLHTYVVARVNNGEESIYITAL